MRGHVNMVSFIIDRSIIMKTYIALFSFALLISSCTSEPAMEQYGSELTLSEVTPISQILDSPADYVGTKVLIEGEVVDICPMKGCWMEVKDPLSGKMMKVKVEDDVIVFDEESKGKKAKAEGEIYEIQLTEEEAMSYMKHLADEKGEAFDSTSITGPMVIYQLQGEGALVEVGE